MNPPSESIPDEPEVLTAYWDKAEIGQLFDDLKQGAEVRHVQVKAGARDQATTLDAAKELLDAGEAKAIQIRYQFQDQLWCDTLMVETEAIRITRMRVPDEYQIV